MPPCPSWPRCFFFYDYYYVVPLCLVHYFLTFELWHAQPFGVTGESKELDKWSFLFPFFFSFLSEGGPQTFPGGCSSCGEIGQAIAREGSYICGTDFMSKDRNLISVPQVMKAGLQKQTSIYFLRDFFRATNAMIKRRFRVKAARS